VELSSLLLFIIISRGRTESEKGTLSLTLGADTRCGAGVGNTGRDAWPKLDEGPTAILSVAIDPPAVRTRHTHLRARDPGRAPNKTPLHASTGNRLG
jgi:hypothetical protein